MSPLAPYNDNVLSASERSRIRMRLYHLFGLTLFNNKNPLTVPINRVSLSTSTGHSNIGNLTWMQRNLRIGNPEHPDTEEALSLVKDLIRDWNERNPS